MGFAVVCRPLAVAKFSPVVGLEGANAFLRKTFMPARVRRLKQRSEFLKVAATRKKWVAPGLILQVRRDDIKSDDDTASFSASALVPADNLRVGFTVSKKVGNAVHRNRARRRLRAVAHDVMGSHASSGVDYVLIGRRDTLDRPYGALRDDLETALRRLKVWRQEAVT